MSDFVTRARELGGLLWRKAKQGGDAAAEMLEQQAVLQRLGAQIRRLDRDRTALLAQIGAKVYALHGQGKVRNQDVLEDCRRLDDIGVEIAKIKQQIEDLRTASLAQGIKLPPLADGTDLTEEPETGGAAATTAAAPVVEPTAPAATSAAEDCFPLEDSVAEARGNEGATDTASKPE